MMVASRRIAATLKSRHPELDKATIAKLVDAELDDLDRELLILDEMDTPAAEMGAAADRARAEDTGLIRQQGIRADTLDDFNKGIAAKYRDLEAWGMEKAS